MLMERCLSDGVMTCIMCKMLGRRLHIKFRCRSNDAKPQKAFYEIMFTQSILLPIPLSRYQCMDNV
jgi:hypothetical protein